MAIRLTCSCGQRLSVAERYLGRKIACPICEAPVKVANPEAPPADESKQLRFRCKCGRKFKAPAKWAGRKTECPECKRPIEIPRPPGTLDTVALNASTGDTLVDLPADAADLSGLLDEIGAHEYKTNRRCRNCSAEMARESVLCIECGYDFRTDKIRETQHGPGGSSMIMKSVRDMFRED